ncbi:hypothetical protein ACOMHN_028652 [Nucella lapillus]
MTGYSGCRRYIHADPSNDPCRHDQCPDSGGPRGHSQRGEEGGGGCAQGEGGGGVRGGQRKEEQAGEERNVTCSN